MNTIATLPVPGSRKHLTYAGFTAIVSPDFDLKKHNSTGMSPSPACSALSISGSWTWREQRSRAEIFKAKWKLRVPPPKPVECDGRLKTSYGGEGDADAEGGGGGSSACSACSFRVLRVRFKKDRAASSAQRRASLPAASLCTNGCPHQRPCSCLAGKASSISPVAILAIMTARAFTSAGRRSPLGPDRHYFPAPSAWI